MNWQNNYGALTLGDKNKLEMSKLVWNVTQMLYVVMTVDLTNEN